MNICIAVLCRIVEEGLSSGNGLEGITSEIVMRKWRRTIMTIRLTIGN